MPKTQSNSTLTPPAATGAEASPAPVSLVYGGIYGDIRAANWEIGKRATAEWITRADPASPARGYTMKEHAGVMGISWGRYMRARAYYAAYPAGPPQAGQGIPDYPSPLAAKTLWELTGDWMIVGDVHVPFTDPGMAGLVVRVARKLKIKRLIIAGDLFNLDVFSTYAQFVAPPEWETERDYARALFTEWLDWFTEIKIIMGNHDRRMQKFTAGQFKESDMLGLITTSDKVQMSGMGYLNLTSGGERWTITHSTEYSVNQLTVASELANKYQTHVMTHHEHHQAMGWDRYKRYCVVNNAALVDDAKLAYVHIDTNKRPNMARGFAAIVNGSPYLFGQPPFTDWARW